MHGGREQPGPQVMLPRWIAAFVLVAISTLMLDLLHCCARRVSGRWARTWSRRLWTVRRSS